MWEQERLFQHSIHLHRDQGIYQDPQLPIAKEILEASDWHMLQEIFDCLGPCKREPLALNGGRLRWSLCNSYLTRELL